MTLSDSDLDALLLDADPVDVRTVREVAASPAAETMRASIATATVTPLRRRRLLAGLGAAAAAAVAIPLALVLVHPSSSESAYGAALVRFAENSPRLLVDADGWHVTRADEDDENTGEMDFANGSQQLGVFWVPGANEKDSDKRDLTAYGTATIDGAQAWVGYTPMNNGTALDVEAIWSVGNQAREARGTFASVPAFLAVAQTLHRVDVDTWLGAMPADVVTPSGRAKAVDEMLADIPLPKDFDESKLTSADTVLDRYQLGAKVTGAVACDWVHQWSHGDAAQRAEAAQAMATSHNWAILNEMDKNGAYSEIVWQIAGAMNGHPFIMGPNNSWTLEQWAKPALGC